MPGQRGFGLAVACPVSGIQRCALMVFVALLVGCGGGPDLTPLAPASTILAFGDSLTRGTGAPRGEGYPEVLAVLTGHPVVNAGVPGELSEQGLRRLPGVLNETAPSLVVLCHGGNDILRKHSHEAAAANLRSMIRLIRESGAQVVLLGVPRFTLLLDTAELYEQVAAEEGVPLEADVLPDVLSDNALKSDTVHPNAEGYAQVARAVDTLLRERGAL